MPSNNVKDASHDTKTICFTFEETAPMTAYDTF